MARRKRVQPRAPVVTTPVATDAHRVQVAACTTAARSGRVVYAMLGALGVLLIGLVWWSTQRPPPQPASKVPSSAIGGVADCRQLPHWIAARSPSPNASFSTSERWTMGLVVADPSGLRYRHPSWDDAGWLGPILLDGQGQVWVAPVPKINLQENPPHLQNQLWRIAADDETLRPVLDLPAPMPPSPQNPYGILGLALDCETDSIYVSSVMGSDRTQVRGTIWQIDTRTGQIRSQWDAVDAMGLVVFRGRTGKRLVYALARVPEVHSVALDDAGAVRGVPRLEFSLAGWGPRGDDRGRRLRIEADGSLRVDGIEFSFNLVAPTEKQETVYRYRYQPDTDRFRLAQIGEFEVN